MDSVMMMMEGGVEEGESVLASTELRDELSVGSRTINPALVFGVGGKDFGEDGERDGAVEESSEEEEEEEEEEDGMGSESRVKEEDELEQKHGVVYAVREAPRLKALPAAARRRVAQARVQTSSGGRGSSATGSRGRRSKSRREESDEEEEAQESRARYASSNNDGDVALPIKVSPTRINSGDAAAAAAAASQHARARAGIPDTGMVTRSSPRPSSASGTSASSVAVGQAKNLGTVVIKTAASTSQSASTSTSASEDLETQHPSKIFAETKPTHSRSKKFVAVYIPPKPQNIVFPYSSLQSGYVFDRRMRFHTELPLAKLDDDFHPEDPRRILEIYDELMAAGLIWDPEGAEVPSVEQMWHITARKATRDEICLVHSETHYEWCRTLRLRSDEELVEIGATLDSVYLHQHSFLAAQVAAGGAIEACKAVVTEKVKNSIAIIRPPGHHAEHAKPGGFCFFNNVCVAARVCQRDFPDRCRKVLILDWDVHHGNGVQEAFYNDPNVLYISLHVYNNGTFYPNGPYGDHLHCGEGLGLGKNVNIPWATHGMSDGDYMYAFQQVVMPIALEFNPDLVIISAGFDAAEGDMLGSCHVSPAGFAHMTHMLMSLAQGKVTACLEGGYNLRSIAKSALAMTRVLMGEPPDRLDEDAEPSASGVKTVQMVMRQQANFWKCMYPKPVMGADNVSGEQIGLRESVPSERMHDVVRAWQSKVLWDEHQMLSLFIRREKISRSFENQVLATPNYNDARPLLVIFHDPPELKGFPNPRTNKIELHNTWLMDATKNYVDWAVKNHFAVVDINIPRHITRHEDNYEYIEGESQDIRANATRELATYLWENYIELGDATHLFFLGIGDAYAGIIDLLSSNESCVDRVTFIVSFVAENSLQSVRRPADDYISQWYYEHSLVLVASNHAVWDPERTRKPRRKYGRLVKSSFNDINNMLSQHKEQVTKTLFEQIHDWLEQYKLDLVETARNKASATAATPGEYMSGGSGGESGSSNSNKYTNGRSSKRLREDSAQLKPSVRNQHNRQQFRQEQQQQQNHPRHTSVNHRPCSSPSASSSRSLPTSPSSKRGITSSTSTSHSRFASTITSPTQFSSNTRLLESKMSPDTKSNAKGYGPIKLDKHNSLAKVSGGDGSGSRVVDVQQSKSTTTTTSVTTTTAVAAAAATSSISPFGAYLAATATPKSRPEFGKLDG